MLERIFLTTDTVGGVWQYSLDLAREYSRRRLAVDLVVVGPAPSAARLAEAAEIAGVGVIVTDLPLDWTAADEVSARAAGAALAALAGRRNAELIHLNSPGLGCVRGWTAPLVATLHSCVGTWWHAVRSAEPLPDDVLWRTALIKEAIRRADAVIVPSASLAIAARRIYGGAAAFSVVYNGRSGGGIALAAAEHDAIFTSGRLWDEAKNVATIDAAAALLDIPIAAAGPVASPLGGRITLPNLKLLGEFGTNDVRRQLAGTGVFVSTALYEPFGLGVLEAAQCGCALVLSDIPSFRELWSGAARFVDPRSPRDVARVIKALAASPQLRTEWGRRAQRRAGRFTTARMAARTLAIYACALRQQARAGGAA